MRNDEPPLWLRKKLNRILGIITIILILTYWFGGEVKNARERSDTYLIHPVPDGVLAWSWNGDSQMVTPTPTPKEEIKVEETIDELITFYCQKYDVREDLVRCVIANESQFNHLAVGDSGKAKGLAQFWIGTWRSFRKLMGLDDSDMRTDKAESIKTMVWGLSQGKGNHWSPIKKGICK